MLTGMLWFDNNTQTNFTDKVLQAASYYQKKYGKKPDLCFAHPSMIPTEGTQPDGIEIRSAKQVLPNHLWLGIHEAVDSSD